MKLRTRIVLVASVLVLVTAALSSGVVLAEFRDVLFASAQRALEGELERRGQRLISHLDELERDVRLISGTPPIAGIIRATEHGGVDPVDGSGLETWEARLETIFEELLDSKPSYLQVRYIGAADGGRELVRLERSPSGSRAVRGDELQRKGNETYFAATATTPTERVFMSAINLNREHGQVQWPPVPVVRAARAIRTPSGELFGLVIINMDLRQKLAEVGSVDDRHPVYVTDERGRYLAHPDPDRSFEFERGVDWTAHEDFSILAEETTPAAPIRSRVGEDRRIEAYVRLPFGADELGNAVYLICERDTQEIASLMVQVTRRTLLVVGVLAALAILLGVWLSAVASGPIRALASAIRDMDVGRGIPDLPASVVGEAGELRSALDRAFRLLHARSEDLERSNRELEQFVYIASHDLQEPVRTVSSFADLLRERYGDALDERGRECLGYLTEATGRMQNLIRGLLDYGRIGASAEVGTADLGALAREACRDLAVSIEESGAEIDVDALPVVRGYPVELRLLLQNLIANGIKFRHPDRPVRIHVGTESRDGRRAYFVADNGIGIPPEQRERAFLIFQRLHAQKEFSGTGIGLAHCRKVVELHHGRIWLEEGPEGGTRVCFELGEVST